MQIKGPLSSTAPSAAAATGPAARASLSAAAMVQGWNSGLTLQATVRQNPQAGPPLLEINGQLLQARNGQTLVPGQQLRLKVIRPAMDAALKFLNPTGQANISLPAPAQSWQAGQVLQARIIQPATGEPSLLRFDGKFLPLNLPPLPALAGQALRLQVVSPGQPVVLQVLDISTPSVSQQAVRDALPRQLPLSSLLAQLQAIIGTDGSRGSKLPAEVLQQVRQILDQLPRPDGVGRADGLQQALANSGIFLEARLAEALRTSQPFAQTAQQLSIDLKGGLLGLLSLLLGLRIPTGATAPSTHGAQKHPADVPPPLPNSQPFAQPRLPASAASLLNLSLPQQLQELLRQVDGSLARIQLSQLAANNEDDGRRSWLLDLPLRHGDQLDLLQIRIDEERGGKGRGSDSLWSVTLAVELDGLGEIHIRVTLTGGVVSATFWAGDDRTAELFEQHLGELQQRLQAAGLRVGNLSARHGNPQTTAEKPALPYVLLDEKA